MSKIVSGLLIGGGVAAIGTAIFYRKELAHAAVVASDSVVDLVTPTKTGYKRIDDILPQLKQASSASGVPLGLLIGWIAKESGGRIGDTTSLDERGYFQLMPSESKKLGLDHQRLSTDSDYSIAGGLKLVQDYAKKAESLAAAPTGTSYFWRLVKLLHTMGSGAVDKIITGAKQAGATGSWSALEQHALDNESRYMAAVKHSPSKWFPLVDKVYDVGRPFGFGIDAGTPVLSAVALAGFLPARGDRSWA